MNSNEQEEFIYQLMRKTSQMPCLICNQTPSGNFALIESDDPEYDNKPFAFPVCKKDSCFLDKVYEGRVRYYCNDKQFRVYSQVEEKQNNED